jgi:N-formylglutamate deformylase
MKSYTVEGPGEIPVILHLPHNSVNLPKPFTCNLTPEKVASEVHTLVDHCTDILYRPILEMGGRVFTNSYCRLFFDPERFSLPEKEIMNEVGMGIFYTHTTDGIRFREDDDSHLYEEKLQKYYWPYHNALSMETQSLVDRFGRVLFIDGHSYPSKCFPFERFPTASRPEIDIGTDSFHTPDSLLQSAKNIFSESFSVDIDQPFKGTLIPNGFYRENKNVSAMMLEVRRDVYLNNYESGSIDINQEGIRLFHEKLQQVIESFLVLG